MRKRKLILNSISSILAQVINLISGFILPKLIIQAYGSDVNGLISSILQFLTVVSLSEFGMTAVVQSSLYKVLANGDNDGISKIIASASKFFRRIGYGLLFYAICLCALYPVFLASGFDYFYVSSMILILSINSIVQYLLGITNNQLLSADQRVYIINITNIVTVILNTFLCFVFIKKGLGIHMVKLVSAIVFLIRPCVSSYFVKKNYRIDRKISYDIEPIQQKWNGLAQHIAYYVFSSTDIIVLTFFSSFANVSIYSVYALILNGLRQIQIQFENAVKPVLGELYAKNDRQRLVTYFFFYEWFMQMSSIFIFGCASVLIVPFVSLYTKNIHDVDYIVPVFAFTITLSYLIQCSRNPYNTIIQAAGHYKQTQLNYIVSAILNLGISIVLVVKYGLIGVAIGTLVAALYQYVWQGIYVYKKIIHFSINNLIYKIGSTIGIFIFGSLICSYFNKFSINSYMNWMVDGIIISIIWLLGLGIYSYCLCGENLSMFITKFIKRKK